MKRRAVFIDRDGTISEEVGYINHPSRFRIFPFAAKALKLLNENNYLTILVTNQAGVARGYFTEKILEDVHSRLMLALDEKGAKLDAIYYCAHHPDVGEAPYRMVCDCRKPKPGLILKASNDFEIDLGESWMVGDRYGDVELAKNAGLHSALVLTGYGLGEWEYQRNAWKAEPDIVADNLLEAVQKILGEDSQATRTSEESGG